MSSLIRCTYALTLSPVAMSLEELLPSKHAKSHVYPILIRTALTISTLVVGLAVPFFGGCSCYDSTYSYHSQHLSFDPINPSRTVIANVTNLLSGPAIAYG